MRVSYMQSTACVRENVSLYAGGLYARGRIGVDIK